MARADRKVTFPATNRVRTWNVRGIASVRWLVHLASEQGVPAHECLHRSAIPCEVLEDALREIEVSQELTVVRNLLRHLGHVPGLGLEAGRRYRPTGYGVLGHMLLSSSSLRSAVESAVRNLDLTFAFAGYRTESLPAKCQVLLDDGAIPEDCRQFLIERDATATMAIMRHLLQEPLPARRVTFRFARPPYAERLEEFFQGPVIFGAAENALVIDDVWMDRPLPQSDEPTARLCEALCRELLDRRRRRTRVSERVRQLLLQRCGCAPMTELAADLGMGPRTLRRHLGSEGTSFRRLVDDARKFLADELLSQKMAVEEVAARLGYAETASFIHAFKRWTGVSPCAYRRGRSDPNAGFDGTEYRDDGS